MLELLKFIFRDFEAFFGVTIILTIILGWSVELIKAIGSIKRLKEEGE